MNVLLLTHQGGIAGSTYSIFYLAQGMARRGHNVYVGCKSTSLLYELCQSSSAQCLPMTFHNKTDLNNARHIAAIVKKYNIQLVNAQSGIDRYTSILAKIFYKAKIPLVHTRRQTPKSNGFFLQNWFYTHGTDKIIAVSTGVKQALVALGLPTEHIAVIHNGTPREKYTLKNPGIIEQLKNKYNIHHDDKVIGCVSRPKQQEQLLEALCYVSRPLTVMFIGAEEKTEWAKITKKHTVPHRILYLGNLAQKELLYHYKLFHIHVLASVTEGLSQALLEAMALQVPVIASDAAGNRDLIRHQKNGLLFEPGNVKQLAEYIEMLLFQPQLARTCIKNGTQTALSDFSIEKTVDNYEKLFENIIRKTLEK